VIRRASRNDLPRIRDLLARANDAPYDLAAVAEEKCVENGFEGEAVAGIYGDFEGIAVTCGKHLRLIAVDRKRRRRGVGRALLRDAEARGAYIVAAEPGNYFTPGILASDATTLNFFAAHGYRETARTQNLEVELNDEFSSPLRPATRDSRPAILDFIERTFGPIWRFEASHGATIFSVEHEGAIAGFSTHDANNRGLGFFGPTGVAPAHRGKRIGWQLLHACLADARRLGYQRVVIPWTDAISYYQKGCGARVAQRFVVLRKEVDSAP